ncbi:MAG: DUF2779 domain-containing protein [Planctomycetota bacterium]|jgi:predicted RecB family nuclease
MRDLNKQLFLDARVCLTLGWFRRHADERVAPSAAEAFLLEQGRAVGQRARELFPGGTLVAEPDLDAAVATTRRLLDDPQVETIFEATFRVDGCTAKADILHRRDGGWRLIEVKSGLDATDEYLDDLAYTTMVLRAAGVEAGATALALLSRDYRLGMDVQRLFVLEDHTDPVADRAEELASQRSTIQTMTAGAERPPAELIGACRSCAYFQEECLGGGIEHHILDLPRLSEPKLAALKDAGIESIEEIPADFELTETQARVRACVVAGEPYVSEGLGRDLARVVWPAFYLDFETVHTALPLYPDVAPYTQIPVQFSVHVCEAPGHVVDHREYLADPRRDGRRELTERLRTDLEGQGSIVVYTSFEKTMLHGLAEFLPDLAPDLEALSARLFDLQAVLREHYYHPAFHGSYSIKVTLPVLVPSMSYDGLEIAEGGAAMAAFARLAQARCSEEEERALRAALLRYCGQDTLAMVRLHEALSGLV